MVDDKMPCGCEWRLAGLCRCKKSDIAVAKKRRFLITDNSGKELSYIELPEPDVEDGEFGCDNHGKSFLDADDYCQECFLELLSGVISWREVDGEGCEK